MASHCFTEPRVCAECDAFDIEFDQRLCPYCDGPTKLLSDHEEAQWYRQQEDMMSEPPMSLDELHRQAWHDRETLRRGEVWGSPLGGLYRG